MQLLEIYNEQLRDLLDNTKSHSRLDIRNTERSGLNVPDAIQVCQSLQCLCHVCQDYHLVHMLCCGGLTATQQS